jgi:hypothetical protein
LFSLASLYRSFFPDVLPLLGGRMDDSPAASANCADEDMMNANKYPALLLLVFVLIPQGY